MNSNIKKRFRGFLPIVVDVETAGFDANKDALLEVALVTINKNANNFFSADKTIHYHIEPFKGANLDKDALEFNQIKPDHPFRFAKTETEAFTNIANEINKLLAQHNCTKAVLIGHNAHFDLAFINAAFNRTNIKNPFHSFTCFDTATLCALAFAETVLAKAMYRAKIPFDLEHAHSAIYDAEKTAELFCVIYNNYKQIR